MCLKRLMTEKEKKRYTKRRVGWKVFIVNSSPILRFLHFPNNDNFLIKEGEWVDDETHRYLFLSHIDNLAKIEPPGYLCGFHIFLNRKDAEKYREEWSTKDGYEEIRKVLFKEIVTFGYNKIAKGDDQELPTVVARRMYVCKKENRKEVKS